ncbi:uncharacterized protein LOC142549786 isoform X1 [Primulina tabacum]|uniref:uncharacterized protein LOC142549786 isoform X1 n=1 Tax=Primulina tabacum TaxID=48773 RepID=UPI003F5A9BB4
MSYFPVGHRGENDDFDHCDPTHYVGGYDIDLIYGRSLPPSYETCYPYRSSASDHPQFASHYKPSDYAFEAPGNEYNSFSGQKSRPGPPASAPGRGFGGPKPNYGFQPGGGVCEHGGRNEYARPEPGYGPGYSMKPASSNFGSSHGRSFEFENSSLIPGREPDYGESGYGPGVRKPASDFRGSRYESGGSGYVGWPEKPTFPKPSYPEPSYPRPYPGPSYPMPSYPEPNYPMPSYPEPSYPAPDYALQKYEHDHSDDYDRRNHDHSHHDHSHHDHSHRHGRGH